MKRIGWLSFPGDQRLTVNRLRSQSVPIVIANVDSFDQFAMDYSIVNQYLAERYQSVVKPRVAPRSAMRPLSKARRGKIPAVFDR